MLIFTFIFGLNCRWHKIEYRLPSETWWSKFQLCIALVKLMGPNVLLDKSNGSEWFVSITFTLREFLVCSLLWHWCHPIAFVIHWKHDCCTFNLIRMGERESKRESMLNASWTSIPIEWQPAISISSVHFEYGMISFKEQFSSVYRKFVSIFEADRLMIT